MCSFCSRIVELEFWLCVICVECAFYLFVCVFSVFFFFVEIFCKPRIDSIFHKQFCLVGCGHANFYRVVHVLVYILNSRSRYEALLLHDFFAAAAAVAAVICIVTNNRIYLYPNAEVYACAHARAHAHKPCIDNKRTHNMMQKLKHTALVCTLHNKHGSSTFGCRFSAYFIFVFHFGFCLRVSSAFVRIHSLARAASHVFLFSILLFFTWQIAMNANQSTVKHI